MIQKENAGETGVYYWKKKEARNLFAESGVQFPGGAMQDDLIHSLLNNDSPVNRKFVEQTETRQFQRWFGDSKVVDRDGEPLVVYHGTGDDFTVFDPWKTNYGDVSEGYSFFTNKRTDMRIAHRIMQTGIKMVM